ncbi:hypothetical protein DICVIV_10005 [Dictyocaulus viviparus]|uniref:BED-type domain-containing protein n=1 Tax=Dictyocaulus viviparus TaxID=29172 RepID=A0A0D8XNK5_DICVI|nr:hypothetical protein DICVIV_10005 [Dictyocaulus viviparus]
MNSGDAEGPACPVAIHPYNMSTAGATAALTMSGIGGGAAAALQMGQMVGPTTTLSSAAAVAAVGLPNGIAIGNIDIANSWCHQFPAYHDIRPMDHTNYDQEIATINYHEISSAQKYEPLKYDYGDIRQKQYDEQRLYHKESDRSVKDEDVKFDHEERGSDTSRDSGAAPAKRGRPTENPCWSYFVRLDDQNVRCRLCNKLSTKISFFIGGLCIPHSGTMSYELYSYKSIVNSIACTN